MIRITIALVLIFSTATSGARDLKITEEYDDFTKEKYYVSKKILVCQPLKSGPVPCADLRLVWFPTSPELVGMNFEVGVYMNMTEIAFNIDGEISQFDANSPVTDMQYDESTPIYALKLGRSSSNLFTVPLSKIIGVAKSKENGIVRVTGLNDLANFDFHRRGGFSRKTPADRLTEFLKFVASQPDPE